MIRHLSPPDFTLTRNHPELSERFWMVDQRMDFIVSIEKRVVVDSDFVIFLEVSVESYIVLNY